MTDYKTCPKGPHSKEEWVDGCHWDFCYDCRHWHYFFPGKTTKPKPKKRRARVKQPQTDLAGAGDNGRVEG